MNQSTQCLGFVVPFAIFIIIIGVPCLINNQEALIIIAIIIINIIVSFPMSSGRRMCANDGLIQLLSLPEHIRGRAHIT